MNRDQQQARDEFRRALIDLGATHQEVAQLAGIHPGSLSMVLNGYRSGTMRSTQIKTDICRKGLMVKAALLGYGDGELLKYSEHRIFGLPEADAQILVDDARRLASERRAEMYGVKA